MFEYVESFRSFVMEVLPPQCGLPFLVMTPGAPNRSRCLFIAKRYKDPVHLGICIPKQAQVKLNEFYSRTRLTEEKRVELYEAWLKNKSDDCDFVIQAMYNKRGSVERVPRHLLTFLRGTHQYSFYL